MLPWWAASLGDSIEGAVGLVLFGAFGQQVGHLVDGSIRN